MKIQRPEQITFVGASTNCRNGRFPGRKSLASDRRRSLHLSFRSGRHQAFQLFGPVQHDIDLRWC
jgi:hypothetical protein